jgi:hypothetical protein
MVRLQCSSAILQQIEYHGYKKMLDASDLIVVGTVIEVKDLDEINWMMFDGYEVKLRGVETTFKVSKVAKGQLATNVVILHHYRLDQEASDDTPETVYFTPEKFNELTNTNNFSLPDALIRFTPNSTNEFDLYLAVDGTNRFAPASGQIEPSYSIMLEHPPWDTSFLHRADASIRNEFQVRVPTKLSTERIRGILRIDVDRNVFEYTNITVGTNMMVGGWSDVYVSAEGMSRPTNCCHELESVGLADISYGNKLAFDWLSFFWRPDGDGVAVPAWSPVPWVQTHDGGADAATKYDVEEDLTIFETDSTQVESPSWNPKKARYYKVLWQGTLKQTVE